MCRKNLKRLSFFAYVLSAASLFAVIFFHRIVSLCVYYWHYYTGRPFMSPSPTGNFSQYFPIFILTLIIGIFLISLCRRMSSLDKNIDL